MQHLQTFSLREMTYKDIYSAANVNENDFLKLIDIYTISAIFAKITVITGIRNDLLFTFIENYIDNV